MNKPKGDAANRDGETERRILEAATTVFVRRGTAGARMQEIAQEAGVNQALLHYYFRSKERLSEAVFRDTAGRMFPALIQALGDDIPIVDKIDRIVDMYLSNMSRTPFLPGYIISELHHHPERVPQLLGKIIGGNLSDTVRPALAKLDKQIAIEARAGRMRRMSAQQFVMNLLSLCIFPFAARPMFCAALALDDNDFAKVIEQRRKELPVYIRHAIKP